MGNEFTEYERRIIEIFDTPDKVQILLKLIPYNFVANTIHSFRKVIRENTAHCLEGALTAAAILEQHGFEPLVLDLESSDNLDYVLFLYEKNGKIGTIGKSRCKRLMQRKPKYDSVEEIVMSYYKPYLEPKTNGRIIGYAVVNLNEIKRADWRFSEENLWKVENYLIEKRHHPVKEIKC